MHHHKLYYPNLNGLRFIAACTIIFYHIEQIRSLYGMPSHFSDPAVLLCGRLAVILFFVLSGFLITVLLLQEKQTTGTVSVKKFYLRRILRIWPLYYLLTITGLFILPHLSFFNFPGLSENLQPDNQLTYLFYIFLLPNLALAAFPPLPYISQLWSIGVEEQFYLIWPWFIKKIRSIFKMLISVIILYSLLRFVLLLLHDVYPHVLMITTATAFIESFNIDCMAFGGLGAWLLFSDKQKIRTFLFTRYVQLFLYTGITLCIASGTSFGYCTNQLYAIVFAILMLNLAANKASLVRMENKFFIYGGKISYGLYMYHLIAIFFALKLSVHYTGNLIILYAGSLIFSICMATISYVLFEKIFLRKKIQYEMIISGDDAK